MKLSDIRVNPKNPRAIKKESLRKLMNSIRDFPGMMELRPMVVNKEGFILGGNMRYRALGELGYTEIPDAWVKRADQLTPEEEKRFIIEDNVQFGEWDYNMLSSEWDLTLLNEWGVEFPPDFDTERAKDDDFIMPEIVETDIVPGDLFRIGPHRLLCGDSTKADTYQALIDGRPADLVITDPPYNVNYGQKAKMLDTYDKGHRNTNRIMNDNMSDDSFYNFLLDFLKATIPSIKPGAAVYVWHAESTSTQFRKAFQDSGLLLKQCLIWVKNTLVLGRQDYQWRHEPCLYGWKPGAGHYFTNERNNTTVIDEKADFRKMKREELLKIVEEIFSEKTKTTVIYQDKPSSSVDHPTMKPVPLMGELIFNSSKIGETVLDPFGGSGSTMVAAHQMKRRCLMIELDPKYCQVILDRMRKLDENLIVEKKLEKSAEIAENVKGVQKDAEM